MLFHSFLPTLQVSQLRLQVWMALDQNPMVRTVKLRRCPPPASLCEVLEQQSCRNRCGDARGSLPQITQLPKGIFTLSIHPFE